MRVGAKFCTTCGFRLRDTTAELDAHTDQSATGSEAAAGEVPTFDPVGSMAASEWSAEASESTGSSVDEPRPFAPATDIPEPVADEADQGWEAVTGEATADRAASSTPAASSQPAWPGWDTPSIAAEPADELSADSAGNADEAGAAEPASEATPESAAVSNWGWGGPAGEDSSDASEASGATASSGADSPAGAATDLPGNAAVDQPLGDEEVTAEEGSQVVSGADEPDAARQQYDSAWSSVSGEWSGAGSTAGIDAAESDAAGSSSWSEAPAAERTDVFLVPSGEAALLDDALIDPAGTGSPTAATGAALPAEDARPEELIDHMVGVLDRLRGMLPATAAPAAEPAATVDAAAVADELERAKASAEAVADFDSLNELLTVAKDRPRDIDTMLQLSGRLADLVALHQAYGELSAAVDAAVSTLRGPAAETPPDDAETSLTE